LKHALAVTLLVFVAACRPPTTHDRGCMGPRTKAETTNYVETSRYEDVVAFLRALTDGGAAIHVSSIGKTSEGREIPYVVASRPLVRTAAEAKRLGRPIVYVQANIHAGEVEGKEAVQALLRDLALEPGKNALDSIVLVAVPIYNADGNERFGPEERNRPEQRGPALVGQRPNGRGLDLNRDYVKAEAEETRAALAMWREWDPDVFVDLHATDGALHGYALTYSPSLNQAASLADGPARALLEAVRRRMKDAHGIEVFPYGNFVRAGMQVDAVDPADPAGVVWKTYDGRPRFGTNYYGLRGRIAVLVEAYSHDPFARRVASTYAFVRELLGYVAEHASDVVAASRRADAEVARWSQGASPDIGLRGRITADRREEEVLVEIVERADAGAAVEPGMPKGLRRTGGVAKVKMPILDRFDATLVRKLPAAYVLRDDAAAVVAPLLAMHGIEIERLPSDAGTAATVQPFIVEEWESGPRFQNHFETTLRGRYDTEKPRELAAGAAIVWTHQPRGLLAMYLLEPESDDGVVTWNFLDGLVARESEFPILRVVQLVRRTTNGW
jgi:hypothetical protein